MSILNVNNFGGGASVADNAPAITAAMAKANAGDTIFFPDVGTYSVASQILLNKAVLFQSPSAAQTILKNTGAFYQFKAASHGFAFDTIGLDGNVLQVFDPVGSDQFLQGLSVTNCIFHGRNWTAAPVGVSEWSIFGWNRQLRNAVFNNNWFQAVECWTAFYGYGWNGVTISNNTFNKGQDPANPSSEGRFIKLFGLGAEPPTPSPYPEGANNVGLMNNCRNMSILSNLFDGRRGMHVEWQDGSYGDIVRGNVFRNLIIVTPGASNNLNEFLASLVCARSVGMLIEQNTFDYSNIPAPFDDLRIALEGGGYGTIIQNNYFKGNSPVVVGGAGAMSVAMNGTNCSGQVINNLFVNAAPVGGGALSSKVTVSNNTATTQLTWDINRPDPGYNAGVSPTPTPTPTPEPTPMPDSPSGTYINSVGPTLILGGVTCGIAAGGRVSISGAPDTHTSGVIGVLSYAGQFYQQQATQWWKCSDAAPKIGSQYVQVAGDPRPVTPPPTPIPTLTNTINIYSDGSVVVTKPSN